MFKIKDKFALGLLAGLGGTVFKEFATWGVERLKLHPSFWDYGVYWIFSMPHHNLPERYFGVIAEIMLGLILSVIYIYWIREWMETRYQYLRGGFLGALVWFGLRGAITLLKIPGLHPNHWIVIVINISIGLIYGLIVEYIIHKFGEKKG